MKLPLFIADCRLPIADCPAPDGAAFSNRQSPIVNRKSREGMALVISLIMLSVTLIMAVAFMALSRRERSAVATTTDTATARLAADSALAEAQARIVANIWTSTNTSALAFNLMVSTNYQNANGYDPNWLPTPNDTRNVNYDYTTTGNPLTSPEMEQNIANLWFQPRVPVFVNNQNTGSNDFRFYLDLNRNGFFETNGVVWEFDNSGFTNGIRSYHTGDPEWIGVLERPDQPHGPDNRFVARYAFFAQPIGNSLDLNYIHNQVLNQSLGAQDGYFRNQGVGSWELNLAAFLADLNTNVWGQFIGAPSIYYQYNWPLTGFANSGVAFNDAFSMLAWRYGYSYLSLATANNYFFNANGVLPFDNIDNYGDGPLQTNTPTVDESILANRDNPALPWPGAENYNKFFALPSDLFDATKSSANFVNRLWSCGISNSTYDRYTFYRMLDQLGTDSAADDDRMNLNYKNVVNGSVVPGMETNLIPWSNALDFFTNAADRMVRAYTAKWYADNPTNFLVTYYNYLPPNPVYASGLGLTNFPYNGMTNQVPSFGITEIPVYRNGQFVYPPALHRLLQLAANLYDASTNGAYPSVFRPKLVRVGGAGSDVYISGFTDISALGALSLGTVPLDTPYDVNGSGWTQNAAAGAANGNVYGVPWIIGAKKGFPSFNQFYARNAVQLTRKLLLRRDSLTTDQSQYHTNEMFVMSITNRLGVSFWNPYESTYPAVGSANIQVHFTNTTYMVLSNQFGYLTRFGNHGFNVTLPGNTWPGSRWSVSGYSSPENQTPDKASFISAVYDFPFLTDSVYTSYGAFIAVTNNPGWELNVPATTAYPTFALMTTNWLNAYILSDGRVIDYVSFTGPNGARDVGREMADPNTISGATKYMWSTNLSGNTYLAAPWGLVNQILVSRAGPASGGNLNSWKQPPGMPYMPLGGHTLPEAEAAYFNGFFVPSYVFNGKTYVNTNLAVQAPYTPTRTSWSLTLWQANDPLVHYLTGDLNTVNTEFPASDRSDNLANKSFPQLSLTEPSPRYQPWGRGRQMRAIGGVDTNSFNLAYRDPLVWGSDYWDFPTNKYPTPGWMGRVHRGSPWQTVYLKASDIWQQTKNDPIHGTANIGNSTWEYWSGDFNAHDAYNSSPMQDGLLFDLFTTRLNENAARGTLSVNQSHLAAWSAVFSGVMALSNSTAFAYSGNFPAFTNVVIEPAGVDGTNSPLGKIVKSINDARAGFVNPDGTRGVFTHVGDVLRASALSESSPFLNTSDASHRNFDVSDEFYEWLPQQVMGLLHVNTSPRYVIYCYGQALRPATGGTVLTGNNFNLVTNYQVVAESAARAVLRVNRNIIKDVDGNTVGTNYTTTVESYNPLPPD